MEKQLSIRRPISMYPREWDVVEEVNERHGLKNTSAALRFIVNEFARLSGMRPGDTAVEPQEENE